MPSTQVPAAGLPAPAASTRAAQTQAATTHAPNDNLSLLHRRPPTHNASHLVPFKHRQLLRLVVISDKRVQHSASANHLAGPRIRRRRRRRVPKPGATGRGRRRIGRLRTAPVAAAAACGRSELRSGGSRAVGGGGQCREGGCRGAGRRIAALGKSVVPAAAAGAGRGEAPGVGSLLLQATARQQPVNLLWGRGAKSGRRRVGLGTAAQLLRAPKRSEDIQAASALSTLLWPLRVAEASLKAVEASGDKYAPHPSTHAPTAHTYAPCCDHPKWRMPR